METVITWLHPTPHLLSKKTYFLLPRFWTTVSGGNAPDICCLAPSFSSELSKAKISTSWNVTDSNFLPLSLSMKTCLFICLFLWVIQLVVVMVSILCQILLCKVELLSEISKSLNGVSVLTSFAQSWLVSVSTFIKFLSLDEFLDISEISKSRNPQINKFLLSH